MRRSQLISWRTREAASDTSSVSRENFSRSNEARSPLAVSYATPQPFAATTRAMAAERNVFPSPGSPVNSRFGDCAPKLSA